MTIERKIALQNFCGDSHDKKFCGAQIAALL
jgi:hypothetical protein